MRLMFIIAFVIIALIIGYAVLMNTAQEVASPAQPPDIPANGFEQVRISLAGNTLSFSSGCRAVTMDVVDTQALAIRSGLDRKIDTRPLTQDIMQDILDYYGIKVAQVRIDSYRDGLYYAKIFAYKDGRVLEMDARPSDAAAIAVRANATAYVKQDVLENNGVRLC